MALQTKVGFFAAPAGTGSQSYTGVGFRPKAILFFGTQGATTYGAQNTHLKTSVGAATSSTDEWAIGNFGFGASTARDVGIRSNASIFAIDDAGIVSMTADTTSLDTDGFTLNWTVTSNARVFWYVAFGGSDVQNVKAGIAPVLTSDTSVVVTTGFRPDLVLCFAAPGMSTDGDSVGSGICFGAWDGTTQYGLGRNSVDGASVRVMLNPKAIAIPSGGANTVDSECSLTARDDFGFTLTVDDQPTANFRFHYLAIKGGRWQVGNETMPLTAIHKVTKTRFKPQMFLTGSVGQLDSGSVVNAGETSFGACDGTNSAVLSANDCGFTWTSNTQAPWIQQGGSITGQAVLYTFLGEGIQLNWTSAAAAAALEYFWVAGADNARVPTAADTPQPIAGGSASW